MRNFRKLLIATLVASQLLTITACGKKPANPAFVPVEDEPSISESQEFSETGESWANSAYKKYWFAENESEFSKAMQDLTPSFELEGHQVYEDYNGQKVVVCGFDRIPLETYQTEAYPKLSEKTAKKVYTVGSENEKKMLLERDYTKASYMNGEELLNQNVIKKFDDVLFVDITVMSNQLEFGYTTHGDVLEMRTHDLPSCGTQISEKVSANVLQNIVDEDGNSYYAPILLKSENMHLYMTPSFIKNRLGWDITVYDDSSVEIWTDAIFKPTPETIIVRATEANPVQSTSTTEVDMSKFEGVEITDAIVKEMTQAEFDEALAKDMIDLDKVSSDVILEKALEMENSIIKEIKDNLNAPKKPYKPWSQWTEAEKEEGLKKLMNVNNLTKEEAERWAKIANPELGIANCVGTIGPTGGPKSSLWN